MAKNKSIINFLPGELIIKQGASNDSTAYMIMRGEAELVMQDKHGKYSHIAYIGPNQTVGEMALIDGESYPVSAIATTRTQCRILDKNSLKQLLGDTDPFVVSLLKLITSRYRALLQQVDPAEDDT